MLVVNGILFGVMQPIIGTTPNHIITRSEMEVHHQIIRNRCNEGCDWYIYVTMVTCADSMIYTLCIQ